MGESGLIDVQYVGDTSLEDLHDTLIRRCRSGERAIREIDNVVNLRWYRGKPFYMRSHETNRLVGLPPSQRTRYIHVNKTFEIVRTIKGVMYFDPAIEPKPRTVDPEDVARAQMALAVGSSIITAGKLGRSYSRVLDFANMFGHGAIKVRWDHNKGGKRPVFGSAPCGQCQGQGMVRSSIGGIAACPTCSAQGVVAIPGGGWRGQGAVEKYLYDEPEGDVVFDAVHPSDLFIDPEAPDLDSAFELIHRTRMHPHDAWMAYGVGLGLHQKDFEPISLSNDVLPSYMQSPDAQLQPMEPEYVTIDEFYQRPTEKHAEGLFGAFVNDKCVVGGRLPYVHDTEPFPFFLFPMYEVYGYLYPMSTVDLCLPLVMALNDHLSSMHARTRMAAKLRFKVPRGSSFEVSDKNGNVYYTPLPRGDKPEELQLGNMPSDVGNMVSILSDSIDMLSAATDVLKGDTSSNESSGRMLAFLDERARGPLKPIMAWHSSILDRVVKYGIDLANLFYDDGRLVRSVGEGGAEEVTSFRESDQSNDVRIVTVRDPGRSRAVMMAELNDAADRGMVDQQTYLDLAQFGDMSDKYKEQAIHRNNAITENSMLMQSGQMPAPIPGEMHDEHIRVHVKKAMSLRSLDPNHPLIPVVLEHIYTTKQVRAQETAEEQMMLQNYQMSMQPQAAAYGMGNAAKGAEDPAVQAEVPQEVNEPYNPAEPGPLDSQSAIPRSDQTAEQTMPPGVRNG